MKREAFEELNKTCSVVSATWFHQHTLARLHSLPKGFGLCAALVESWWERTRNGLELNLLRDLQDVPSMTALVRRQCDSAYPSEPPDRETLGSNLEGAFGVAIAGSLLWQHCEAPPPVADIPADEPGLRLLLLRYGKTGHRMAFSVGPKGHVRFFDPNAGEVITDSSAQFRDWFALFWVAGGYAAKRPDVTLFCFKPLGREAISSREN